MATINGKDVNVQISADSGTTYKTLICETSNEVAQTRETTSTQTKCNNGTTAVALGALTWSISGNGVADTAPSVTQVSYEDMNGWMSAGTLLKVKVSSTGNFHHEGDAYLTELTQTNEVNGMAEFSFTFSGNGALDITE